MYRCIRTFTSQTTWKMFAVNQEISQHEYDMLRLTEKHNFVANQIDITPSPVFNPPFYTQAVNYDTDLI